MIVECQATFLSIFVSHQWLGKGHPDKTGAPIAATAPEELQGLDGFNVCVCVRVRARVRGGVRACGRWMDQSCDKKGNILPYMYVYTYMYTHTPMASDILNRCA